MLTKHRDRLDALAAKLIAEETVEGAAFESLFDGVAAKPAAYSDVVARLKAAGINLPPKPDVEPAATQAPQGGTAAGQPA